MVNIVLIVMEYVQIICILFNNIIIVEMSVLIQLIIMYN